LGTTTSNLTPRDNISLINQANALMRQLSSGASTANSTQSSQENTPRY
jgi:hypothetical protein